MFSHQIFFISLSCHLYGPAFVLLLIRHEEDEHMPTCKHLDPTRNRGSLEKLTYRREEDVEGRKVPIGLLPDNL